MRDILGSINVRRKPKGDVPVGGSKMPVEKLLELDLIHGAVFLMPAAKAAFQLL